MNLCIFSWSSEGWEPFRPSCNHHPSPSSSPHLFQLYSTIFLMCRSLFIKKSPGRESIPLISHPRCASGITNVRIIHNFFIHCWSEIAGFVIIWIFISHNQFIIMNEYLEFKLCRFFQSVPILLFPRYEIIGNNILKKILEIIFDNWKPSKLMWYINFLYYVGDIFNLHIFVAIKFS